MPYSTTGKNNMMGGIGVTHVSLHSGIPDNTGSNEISGGSPAYARKAMTLAAASGGARALASTPTFDVPASTTVMFLGFWDALTSGNFLGWSPVNGGSVKGVATVAVDDTLTSNGHGLSDGDRVFLQTVVGESLPTGLSATTVYYVVSSTTNTFKVSTTLGGSAVDVSAVGECFFQKVIPEVYGAQGTFAVSSGSLDLNG